MEREMTENDSQKLYNLANIVKFAMTDDLKRNINFRENFIIGEIGNQGKATPTPVGGMCLDVTVIDDKIIVYLSASMFDGGAKAGSKISSWLDVNLHTLEEKRSEYKNGTEEVHKTLYMGMKCDSLLLHHTASHGVEVKMSYSLWQIKNLISEGANFVLLRCLALNNFIGEFETTTLYINGDLCRNLYRCPGPQENYINGKNILVYKVYRTIIEKCGLVHNCCTMLTFSGQTLSQEWTKCPLMFYINPHATITNNRLVSQTYSHLPRRWEDDMILFSKYLDTKQLAVMDTDTYIKDHSEIRDLLADYLMTVMQLHPENPLEFTLEYFKNFT